jgi:Family of unknown function (DUF5372)
LIGREFDLVDFVQGFVEQRVLLMEPGDDQMLSVPASWTDAQAPDPFVVVAAGRSLFRPEDLLELVRLLHHVQGTVKEILP